MLPLSNVANDPRIFQEPLLIKPLVEFDFTREVKQIVVLGRFGGKVAGAAPFLLLRAQRGRSSLPGS